MPQAVWQDMSFLDLWIMQMHTAHVTLCWHACCTYLGITVADTGYYSATSLRGFEGGCWPLTSCMLLVADGIKWQGTVQCKNEIHSKTDELGTVLVHLIFQCMNHTFIYAMIFDGTSVVHWKCVHPEASMVNVRILYDMPTLLLHTLHCPPCKVNSDLRALHL